MKTRRSVLSISLLPGHPLTNNSTTPPTHIYAFGVNRLGDTTGFSAANWAAIPTGDQPTSASDFPGNAFPSGKISFAAGESAKTITIKVRTPVTGGTNETFAITLSNPIGAGIATGTASSGGSLDDNSRSGFDSQLFNSTQSVILFSTLAIKAGQANRAEGSSGGLTPYTFTITRSGNTAGTSQVNWGVTGSGTSPANAADFQGGILPSGTVSFAAGETSKTITVNVNADQTVEANETFAVTLSSPRGAAISTAQAVGSIRNDDTTLRIRATNANQLEGSSGGLTPYTFTIARSGNTAGTSQVNWKVTGTGASPANAADFQGGVLPSGTITFAAGETSKTITVNVNADQAVEANETFAVTLSSPVDATISVASATGTIQSDDFGLSNRQERLLQTGRWLESLDPRVQAAISTYQSPERLAATDPKTVANWVIGGENSNKASRFEAFAKANGLKPKQDLSVVYNLPGISFWAIEAGSASSFAALKKQADAEGLSLWYELRPDNQEDGPINLAEIEEPAFTGTVTVNGRNASLIHLLGSDLSNPTSPNYGINAVDAWQRAGGEGVVVSVKDSPFDLFHTDLVGQLFDRNIDITGDGISDFSDLTPALSPNGVPDIFESEGITIPGGDPSWVVNGGGPSQEHGTAVAGIIAAEIDGSQSVGVAPQVKWIPDVGFNTDFSLATRNLAQIINNSWGASRSRGIVVPSPTELQNWRNAWENSANHPAISQLVNSAGNGRNLWQNVNTRGFNRFRQVISVAAAQRRGDIEGYSTPGATVLVAAPVNSNLGFNTLTSDVSDDPARADDNRGYRNGNLTEGFNGTSAAAPMVSGVIALMLEVNPALTRRDIQHILIRTAQKNRLTDSNDDGELDAVIAGGTTELRTSFTATQDTDLDGAADPYNTGWFRNGAGHWVSDSFGFGIVDAGAAVELARDWNPAREELQLTSNRILTGSAATADNGTLGGLNSLSSLGGWDISSNLKVEWAEVELDLDIDRITELMLVLVSPSGTRSVLLNPGGTGTDSLSFTGTRTLISNQFWDESARGTWSLEAIDVVNNSNVQTIANATLNLYGTCSKASPLTISSYEELATESNLETSKQILTDRFLTSGGASTGQYEVISSSAIGANSSWGIFADGSASNLNVDRGLIFTSGKAKDALGPNKAEDTTTSHGLNGSWITDQLVAGSTFDASGIEVIFKAASDINLQWNFQFGSEEFQEWAGSQFNDAAGIFIAEVTEKNAAAVKAGQPYSGLINLTRQAYLDDGSIGTTGGPSVNSLDRGKLPVFTNSICGELGWEYDGGTGPRLHSQVAQLRAGKTYVLTAIAADTADRLYDSGLIFGESTVPHVLVRSTTNRVLEDGNANLEFLFERTGPLADALTINYTVGGTATLGSDYSGIATTGTIKSLTFAPDSSTATLIINPTSDNIVEPDETVSIALASGNGYNVATQTAVNGTIANDDASLAIRAASASKVEGSGGGLTAYTFTVARSGATTGNSTVAWSVAGSGSIAASAADFPRGVFPSGSLSFTAGESTKTITVNVNADSTVESNESFAVTLANPVGATITTATATGTIRNDDGISLAITPVSASRVEGHLGSATPYTFAVTRAGNTTGTSSAQWAVAGTGLFPAGVSDFQGGVFPSGTVSFAAGETSKFITVNVRPDLAAESSETFRIGLSNPTGGTITTSTATGTIINDDIEGTPRVDVLIGTSLNDFINGRASGDNLTGGDSADIFGFNIGESTVVSPDRITDFTFGSDKIKLLSSNGSLLSAPTAFTRAADNATATSITGLASAVFADANGALGGNQPLGANQAGFVVSTNRAIAGRYIFINDSIAALSSIADTAINITGNSGTLPPFGASLPSTVFV
jgi:subtilisin-like proprotein convertase family protein